MNQRIVRKNILRWHKQPDPLWSHFTFEKKIGSTLADYIIQQFYNKKPMTHKELHKYMQCTYDKIVIKDWVYAFIERHLDK